MADIYHKKVTRRLPSGSGVFTGNGDRFARWRDAKDTTRMGPLSRYRIAKDSGVDASQLLRFMRGDGRLTNDSLDKIGDVLKLRLESDLEQ